MTSPVVNITLLVPGMGRNIPTSAVQWSDSHALQPWQSQFCKQLAQEQWNGRHLPVAELLIGQERDGDHETGEKMQGVSICADPVHLRADRDTARLVPAAMLSLTDAEADALLTTINEFLAVDNLQLSRSDACHWYLHGMDGSALLTFPPEFLAQRNASAFLPEGEATGHWKLLMTELQMLLHSHPVNAEREQRGLMSVNCVWFWGGAPLTAAANHPLQAGQIEPQAEQVEPQAEQVGPHSRSHTEPQSGLRIHADEAFAVALARHLGLECRPLSDLDPCSAESDILVVDRRLEQALLARDESGVEQARQRMQEWVDCWQNRLQQGENLTLDILDEDGMRGRLDAQVLKRLDPSATKGLPHAYSLLAKTLRRLPDKALTLWRRLTGGGT